MMTTNYIDVQRSCSPFIEKHYSFLVSIISFVPSDILFLIVSYLHSRLYKEEIESQCPSEYLQKKWLYFTSDDTEIGTAYMIQADQCIFFKLSFDPQTTRIKERLCHFDASSLFTEILNNGGGHLSFRIHRHQLFCYNKKKFWIYNLNTKKLSQIISVNLQEEIFSFRVDHDYVYFLSSRIIYLNGFGLNPKKDHSLYISNRITKIDVASDLLTNEFCVYSVQDIPFDRIDYYHKKGNLVEWTRSWFPKCKNFGKFHNIFIWNQFMYLVYQFSIHIFPITADQTEDELNILFTHTSNYFSNVMLTVIGNQLYLYAYDPEWTQARIRIFQ